MPLIHSNTQDIKDEIQKVAKALHDMEVLDRIHNLPADGIIAYHNNCRLLYVDKITDKSTSKNDEWHENRDFHKEATNVVLEYVKATVVTDRKPVLLTELCQMYETKLKNLHYEKHGQVDASYKCPPSLLQQKITKYAKSVQTINVKRQKIILPNDGIEIDLDEVLARQDSVSAQNIAFQLRDELLNVEKTPLPECLEEEHLIAGEAEVPQKVKDFVRALICGVNPKSIVSPECNRKVESISQDLMYAAHHGKIKNSKHITLGIALKSLTSSRKVIDIIHRFGHCCSYTVIEELETEATYHASSKKRLFPEGAHTRSIFFTKLAWDNFDRYVETLTGKSTLHDTVGILIQNILPLFDIPETEIEHDESTSASDFDCSNDSLNYQPRSKRRRTYQSIPEQIKSYTKKPKIQQKLLPLDDPLRLEFSDKLQETLDFTKKLDLLWVMSHREKIKETPMWVGFNCRIIEDSSAEQKIFYLPPINKSPTDLSVVYETMRQSQIIAQECLQSEILVTYDLAIAKLAWQIQCEEKNNESNFNNVFVDLGDFHLQMAGYNANGTLIDGCGLLDVAVECDLLASGSVNGVLSGKHFNRSKRLHAIMALGLRILHFEAFLETFQEGLPENYSVILENMQKKKLKPSDFENEDEKKIAWIMDEYCKYEKNTMSGDHGKTAKFYMIYIQQIQNQFDLSRSIRTGNFELYKHVLPKFSNIFFIFNQVNYARWLLLYSDKLLQVQNTHPMIYSAFKCGLLGVKRTSKPFSRIPNDLTLEQTYNADAGKKLTGISHFTNSIGARERWARSNGFRSAITTHLLETIGLKRGSDTSNDLKKQRILTDAKNVNTFMETIKKNINPFSNELDKAFLYNIKTGKAASEEVADFLLNVEVKGAEIKDKFIQECSEFETRFEEPIKKNKILNFSKNYAKKNIKLKDKVTEVQMQRDLFGRMLGISMTNETDIERLLSYPLTPVPLSMCHLDGTACKTAKSALGKCLKNVCDNNNRAPVVPPDVIIIDGFYMLHTFSKLGSTYAHLSKHIISTATLNNPHAKEYHFIFDQYKSPSIKDFERSLRSAELTQARPFVITGNMHVTSSTFAKDLKNPKFKKALVTFLINHWGEHEMYAFFKNKKFILSYDLCYSYECNEDTVCKKEEEKYSCPDHEEADTRIIYHIYKTESALSFLVKCTDTDILVLLLGNMSKLNERCQIWIEGGKNKDKFIINVRSIYEKLGPLLSKALPGFHAITGCDQNPAFYNKGKLRPYKKLVGSQEYQELFADLSEKKTDDLQEVFQKVQRFFCEIYGQKTTRKNEDTGVNTARYEIFLKNYKMKNINEPFAKRNLKNFDGSCLPPCRRELWQHFLRTYLITKMWMNSTEKELFIMDTSSEYEEKQYLLPTEYGWTLNKDDNSYEFKWFDGLQLPDTVKDVIIESDGKTIFIIIIIITTI